MRTRRRATIEDLRQAIDCLPRRTRVAMLEGIAANDIIVGAYATREGICPMLAAHRSGGRTSLIAFAQAWDRVAFRGQRSARARRATERELLILRSHLEASLLQDAAPPGALGVARREHETLMARRRAGAARPGEPDRARALNTARLGVDPRGAPLRRVRPHHPPRRGRARRRRARRARAHRLDR